MLCPLLGVKAAAFAALRATTSAFLVSLASVMLLKASMIPGWCRCTVLILTLRPSGPLGGFFSHSLSWTTSCKEGDSYAQPGQECYENDAAHAELPPLQHACQDTIGQHTHARSFELHATSCRQLHHCGPHRQLLYNAA